MTMLVARRYFTVVEYHKMAEAGILGEDDRVELIEGEIVQMSPIGRGHLACVDRLNDLLVRGLGDEVIVRVQGSIRLNGGSEPEPDLVLLRRRPDFYASADAGPEDVLLVIEVADSSLAYDYGVKVPLYARAGISELWLVDLRDGSMSVFLEPAGEGYRSVVVVRGDDCVSPHAFPELVLTLGQILGAPHA